VVVVGDALAVVTPVDVAPALQVYDAAPPAVRFAVKPEQIVGLLTTTVGGTVTVTDRPVKPPGPQALLPVTVMLPLVIPAVAVIVLVVDVPDHPEGSTHV